ncbi:HipA N-terminal domain-containing protein [Massilia yuzhufengensis]|uniref:Serine/threonine-protein kinase HipA n=1 Tax=Massilia yuzhufengensis TaxID=1164594 RepID=A0A1I1HQG6_9BURK|nr:HipA N-terminal domain-containing protein [Massilia yuzhufengensis]SFC23250.1 serine/threonine-protein kinase HipA [Massilia yuzhufengensis]
MGRHSHSQTLNLWANREYVGRWTVNASGDSELHYDAGWCASPRGRPISLSLPFNLHNEPLKGARAAHYFDRLQPDSDSIRNRVAVRFKTGSIDAFDLLAAIGRDCVCALQLPPDGALPQGLDHVDGTVIDDKAIERHPLDVVNPNQRGCPKGADDDFQISLAGAQEKDAFLWWQGEWMGPQ